MRMRRTIHRMRLWVPLLLALAATFSSKSSSPSLVVEASSDVLSTRSNSGSSYSIRAAPPAGREQSTEKQQKRRQLYERISNSGDDPPQQVRIRPFTLVLRPWSVAFDMDELPALHDAIQYVIEQHIRKESDDLDYVLLGDILELTKRNEVQEVNNGKSASPMRKNAGGGASWTGDGDDNQQQFETAMEFPFGVAAFMGPTKNDHTPGEVNNWVKEALENDLVDYLTQEGGPTLYDAFGGVTKAEVVLSLADPDDEFEASEESQYENEGDEEDGVETQEIKGTLVDGAQVGDFVAEDGRKWNTRYGVILACIMGAAAIVIAFAFILKRFRGGPIILDPMGKDSDIHIDDAATEMDYAETDHGDATSDISELESEVAHYHQRRVPSEGGDSGGSMAGSSVGGHSAPEELADAISVTSEWTLSTHDESMANGSSSGPRRGIADSVNTAWAASSDNFDRDRQVNISKDMLHSMWSGPQTGTAAVPNIRQPARGDFSSWRTEQGDSPAFVFEQANGGGEGEEVYLMPPTSRATNSDDEVRTFESA